MKKLRLSFRAAAFFIVLLFTFSQAVMGVSADTDTGAKERKTVRVGYFIGEGFQEVSPVDGQRSGYCYEYF